MKGHEAIVEGDEMTTDGPPRNRAERRAAKARNERTRSEKPDGATADGSEAGVFDEDAFLALAGRFIDLANRQNRAIDARNVALALRWAAARYEAHVAKNVNAVELHEPFVAESVKGYTEMLRQHLADPHL